MKEKPNRNRGRPRKWDPKADRALVAAFDSARRKWGFESDRNIADFLVANSPRYQGFKGLRIRHIEAKKRLAAARKPLK